MNNIPMSVRKMYLFYDRLSIIIITTQCLFITTTKTFRELPICKRSLLRQLPIISECTTSIFTDLPFIFESTTTAMYLAVFKDYTGYVSSNINCLNTIICKTENIAMNYYSEIHYVVVYMQFT